MRMSRILPMVALVCLLSWAGSVFGADAVSVVAGPITNRANGHVYYLLGQNTWKNSQAEAAILGGNLASIKDELENQWVLDTFSNYGGTHRSLWLGLTDAATSGSFKWVDGKPVTYLHWAASEPNLIGTEHFVYMFPRNRPDPVSQPAGYWNNFTDQSMQPHGASPIHGVVKLPPSSSSNGLSPAFNFLGNISARVLLVIGLLSLIVGAAVGVVLLTVLRNK
jgi:hypothetical protein